jgi:hypothetical protein
MEREIFIKQFKGAQKCTELCNLFVFWNCVYTLFGGCETRCGGMQYIFPLLFWCSQFRLTSHFVTLHFFLAHPTILSKYLYLLLK